MNKLYKNDFYIKITIILVGLLLYFVGFYFKEFSPAGSQSDFKIFVFRNIHYFRDDLISSIKNYGEMKDSNFPFFYIFHAYLNPFSYSPDTYLFSTFSIGLLTVFFFFLSLKNLNFQQIDALSLSSLLLYLPWFSGRAFWGTASNLAWFFFLISIFLFLKFKQFTLYDINLRKIKTIFLLCLFSSITLYIKPIFIFFVLFVIFFNIVKKKFIYLKIIIPLYVIFSIPGFLLIFFWGGIYDHSSSITKEYFNYKNILYNIPIILSYFFFYLWPVFLIKLFSNIKKKNNIINFFKIFMIYFIFLIILNFFGYLDYLKEYTYGGGAFIKLGYYLKDEYNIIFFLSSSFGFCIVINYLRENIINNLMVILLILIFFGLPKFLYQDYFEPLIFVLVFTKILNSNFNIYSKKNFSKLILIYGFFFFLYNQILFFKLI